MERKAVCLCRFGLVVILCQSVVCAHDVIVWTGKSSNSSMAAVLDLTSPRLSDEFQ